MDLALPEALAPLPHALVHGIFMRLSVDERARAASVSRGWRAFLKDYSFWTRLELAWTEYGAS
jgi:hypothetical protein